MAMPNNIRLWLLLAPLIPSIIVSIFNLYHLLKDKALRNALNNHVIICLLSCGLFIEVTDVTWQVHYYRTNTVLIATPSFCLAWTYIRSIFLIASFLFMAWGSIERHILIFYSNCFSTKTKRLFFHYLPLCICFICPCIFYAIVLFILPCAVPYTYDSWMCNRYSCYIRTRSAALWESIIHFILPAFITTFSSIVLLIRVINHRHRIQQRITWRNYKKLASQLLPISAIYLIFDLPPMTLYAAYSAGLSWSFAADYFSDGLFLLYWIIFLVPFASVMSLPDIRAKCKDAIFFWRSKRVTMPVAMTTARTIPGKANAQRTRPAALANGKQ
ncbi:unnamed protein product [Adineta ricciae]|uniref:G-protein coupled receptors family 1 profile domain-containing protein n=1 Tax=Adineta ricciae TaxID=249248 RepID=A0A815JCK7_ADIRI|nr:unnamed protein product [Adineta ricciae]CAF1378993.1 unnamed protein product [Adineta ricciae]